MSHFFRKALWHNDKQMKNIPPLLDTKQISAICSSFFDAAPAAAAVSRAWEHIGQGQFSSPLALGWRGNSGDFRAGERSRNFRYRLSSSSPSPSPGKTRLRVVLCHRLGDWGNAENSTCTLTGFIHSLIATILFIDFRNLLSNCRKRGLLATIRCVRCLSTVHMLMFGTKRTKIPAQF